MNVVNYNGVQYSHRGNVDSTLKKGGATARASQVVPAGYLGVSPYIYKNGALCNSTGVAYTTYSSSAYSRSISGNCGSGNYQGSGYTYFYNPDTGRYYAKLAPLSPATGW